MYRGSVSLLILLIIVPRGKNVCIYADLFQITQKKNEYIILHPTRTDKCHSSRAEVNERVPSFLIYCFGPHTIHCLSILGIRIPALHTDACVQPSGRRIGRGSK